MPSRSFVLISLFLFAASFGHAKSVGFERPRSTKKAILGKTTNTEPPSDIRFTCEDYSRFAVVSINDPSLKGEKIQIRTKTGMVKNICGPHYHGSSIDLPNAEGVVDGVAGNYIFIRSADTFGVFRDLSVYDALTLDKMFSGIAHENKPLVVRKKGAQVGFRYFQALEKLPCDPHSRDASCWYLIKKENSIPENVAVSAPNCNVILNAHPDAMLQITVPAEIKNLKNPVLTYLPGKATCNEAP